MQYQKWMADCDYIILQYGYWFDVKYMYCAGDYLWFSTTENATKLLEDRFYCLNAHEDRTQLIRDTITTVDKYRREKQ